MYGGFFMAKFIIEGGKRLNGEIEISVAKNACLPIIACSVLFPYRITLFSAPKIIDVSVMAQIIEDLGGQYQFNEQGLYLDCRTIKKIHPSSDICVKARASFFTVGALLGRFKKAIMCYPGGCSIGIRPVDIHLDCLKALGVKIVKQGSNLYFDGSNMHAGYIKMRYPSVGATVNAIGAAVSLKGETVIANAATEPEIYDLCSFLNKCGCKIRGGGNKVIVIEGCDKFDEKVIEYKPMYDRIEAGTFMLACLSCGGEISFFVDCYKPIESICSLIKKCGSNCYYQNGVLHMQVNKRIKAVNAIADVFPLFPTDLQPQYVAAMSVAKGKSVVEDRVFPNRFAYVESLNKMGANVVIENKSATVNGVSVLKGAVVSVPDLRGGAALVIAALSAEGISVVERVNIIQRGYEGFDKKLRKLGAVIYKIE